MRFLNTLKKAKKNGTEAPANAADESESADMEDGSRSSEPPLRDGAEFIIGKPVIPGANSTSHSQATVVEETRTPRGIPRLSSTAITENHKLVAKPDFAKFEVVPSAVNKRLIPISDPYSPFCEDYRGLRTHIISGHNKGGMKSLVIMSFGQAEGKTVTAINVSWLLAQTDGISALLIDGDMRLPSVAEYLGFEPKRGLSDLLAGEVELQDVVFKLETAGLHILPGGSIRDDVGELASGPKFKALLDQAESLFDYVIIDVPPISMFADAAVMANSADAALLVVRSDSVGISEIGRVLDLVPREKLIGTVLNASDEALASRSYYGDKYYGRSRE